MAHTKEQLAELEAKSKILDDIRHAFFSDYSDDEFRELMVDILARHDGLALRLSLKSFEGDSPELRADILKVCQHPKLKPLIPH